MRHWPTLKCLNWSEHQLTLRTKGYKFPLAQQQLFLTCSISPSLRQRSEQHHKQLYSLETYGLDVHKIRLFFIQRIFNNSKIIRARYNATYYLRQYRSTTADGKWLQIYYLATVQLTLAWPLVSVSKDRWESIWAFYCLSKDTPLYQSHHKSGIRKKMETD